MKQKLLGLILQHQELGGTVGTATTGFKFKVEVKQKLLVLILRHQELGGTVGTATTGTKFNEEVKQKLMSLLLQHQQMYFWTCHNRNELESRNEDVNKGLMQHHPEQWLRHYGIGNSRNR